VPAAYAAYSANLILLLLLIADAEAHATADISRANVRIAELQAVGTAQGTELSGFHTFARLWYAHLTTSEWQSLLEVIRPEIGNVPRTHDAQAQLSLKFGYYRELIHGREILNRSNLFSLIQEDRFGVDTPAVQAFREATLLGATGYSDACATLLPYLSSLGTSDSAGQFQIGDLAASLLFLLVSEPYMATDRRAMLYVNLFTVRPGTQVARLLLTQLRKDMSDISLTQLAKAALTALPYAWTNITAYLDIVQLINNMARSSELVAVPPFDLSVIEFRDIALEGPVDLHDLLEFLHPEDPFEEGEAIDLRDSLDLLKLLDPLDLLGVQNMDDIDEIMRRAKMTGFGQEEVRNLLAALGLRDLLGLRDVGSMLDAQDLLRPGGLQPAEQAPSSERRRLLGTWISSAAVQIALWTGMAKRGLEGTWSPPLLERSGVAKLEEIAPEFVSQTRILAAERGLTDPLPSS